VTLEEFLTREVVSHPAECGPCPDCQSFVDEHEHGALMGSWHDVHKLNGSVTQVFIPEPPDAPSMKDIQRAIREDARRRRRRLSPAI